MVDAGWFPDPESPSRLRWWDGQAWTEHRYSAAPVAPVVAPPATPPTATPPTASYWGGPEPRRNRSRTLFLAIGIPVAAVLLIGIIVFSGIVARQYVPRPAAVAGDAPSSTPAAQAPTSTTADLNQPGMVGTLNTVTPGGTISSASAAFADESSHYATEGMDQRCAQLAFGSPVDGYGPDANDELSYYTNFITQSGGTSMSGAAQAFSSAAEVRGYLSRLGGLIDQCSGGFTDGDGVDTVTNAHATGANGEQYAWTQVVKTSTRSYTVHSIEWRNGPIVGRSWCYRIAGTTDSPTICDQWATEVQFAIKNSH